MKSPFIEHVRELRRRLIVCVLFLIAGAAVGYWQQNALLTWLQAPLGTALYYNQVLGAFEFLMQACLLVGLIITIPVIVYNLVSFVRPALPHSISRSKVFGLVTASTILTIGGAGFAYYVSLPVVLRFLSSIEIKHLHPLIQAGSYLNFVTAYLAIFALIFQLPLLIWFIDKITPIPPRTLMRARKWVWVGAFGLALILPMLPDPVSQAMLAVPIVVMYEVCIWIVVIRHKLASRKLVALETPEPAVEPPLPSPVRQTTRRDPVLASGHPRVIDLR